MEFKFERKTFNINERLRIGIISDSQLSPVRRKNETTFRNNLVLSLSVLKKQGCNMIIFAGDIGNMASGFAYDTYKAAFKSVFGEKIPIIQSFLKITNIGWATSRCLWRSKAKTGFRRSIRGKRTKDGAIRCPMKKSPRFRTSAISGGFYSSSSIAN